MLKFAATVLNLPPLRPISWRLLSGWASRLLNREVRIFFDSVWLRKDGEVTIALGLQPPVKRSFIRTWKPSVQELTDLAASWWYLFYHPKPGDVIVDIGAGMGEDAILFARSIGEKGSVYSFEAHPVTALCLKKTVEHSKLSNVMPINGAILDRSGTLEIEDLPSEQWQENSVIQRQGRAATKTFSVPGFSLDEFEPLQKHKAINFIKMNIEGAETNALLGMKAVLSRTRYICVACHDFLADKNPQMRTKEACRRILQEAGFTVRDADPESPPWQRDQIHGIRNG